MDRLWGMEVFIRIMECGSFSRAAESLDLANATVTSNLRNLEKHLGVTLIQRNTRYLSLTEEGRLFLPQCQEILRAVAQAESKVRTTANQISGPLRIEAPFAIGQSLICPALAEFAKLHAELSIFVTLTNHPLKLIEHGTDIAIRMDRIEDADLVGRPVYEARRVVCCAPALADLLGMKQPQDIDPKRCLGLFKEGHNSPVAWLLEQGEAKVVVRPQGALNFNNTQALIQAAVQEMGLIYVLDIFVADLIASAKKADSAHPVFYTTAGNGSGSHLFMELFASRAGINLTPVPYKGAAPAMTDVLGGQVPLTFDNIITTLPLVESGKLRALAVSSKQRSKVAPSIPTLAESGVPGYDATSWFGLFVPAGTPDAVVQRLSAAAAAAAAVNTSEVRTIFHGVGAESVSSTPAEFQTFFNSEVKKWSDVIKRAKIQLQ